MRTSGRRVAMEIGMRREDKLWPVNAAYAYEAYRRAVRDVALLPIAVDAFVLAANESSDPYIGSKLLRHAAYLYHSRGLNDPDLLSSIERARIANNEKNPVFVDNIEKQLRRARYSILRGDYADATDRLSRAGNLAYSTGSRAKFVDTYRRIVAVVERMAHRIRDDKSFEEDEGLRKSSVLLLFASRVANMVGMTSTSERLHRKVVEQVRKKEWTNLSPS